MKKVKQQQIKTQTVSKVTFVTYADMISDLKQKSVKWKIPMKKFISACIFLGLSEKEEVIKGAILHLEEKGGEV